MATSLGLGVQQVTTGMNYLFDIPANSTTMVVLIVVITAIALTSVMTGINVGIKRLSQFNIVLAFLLLLAVIFLGPTLYILRTMFDGLVTYGAKIVPLSNWIGREDTGFLSRLDHVLLGMVDRLGALRRHLHRPHIQGAYRTPVCDICAAHTDAVMPNMVRRIRRHRTPATHGGRLYGCDGERCGVETGDCTVQDV